MPPLDLKHDGRVDAARALGATRWVHLARRDDLPLVRGELDALEVRRGEEVPCDTLESCLAVSRYLLDRAGPWLD